MIFKQLLLWILFSFFCVNLFSQSTQIVYLSGTDAANTVEWDFFCTDGQNSNRWTTIPVPSNWELQGFGTYNYGHDWKDENIEIGKEHGIYKHNFDVPDSWKGKTINIVFDGVMTDCLVKINGTQAGEIHQGAFYRFKYNISKLLQYGEENLLEVDVAKHSANESVNRAERQADFWIFGGIFRPVFLEVLPPTHIKRAAIDPKADGSFNTLIILNNAHAKHTVNIDLFDMNGSKIGETVYAEFEKGNTEHLITGHFDGIKPWSTEWPNLYNMKITLKKGKDVLHELTKRIGFRTVELREHDGFYINGEKVVFKGVNRHSFWPETGRCLSEEHHLTDIRLLKEMNMNAVRMSHYVPDKRFLELCDSLGLFVLNEICGWQQGYDTIVGQKIIKETVLKDENHPCVVIWNNGNEGGWDFNNEKIFHKYDIQKRPVLYPWLLRNGADTHHYIDLRYGIGRFVYGNDPFMPTEFLHGLYDGGHGAGLEDYWRFYETSPLHAGGFLWVLADEAVLRTDKEGTVYDADGNHAPDGIVGPHRQKEGSFYTIREIWSPVQVKPTVVNKKWNGRLFLENKFIYTNLKDCSFSWKTIKTGFAGNPDKVIESGTTEGPDAIPGETAAININCSKSLKKADLFLFTATDPHGSELYTWSWPVVQPIDKMNELSSLLAGKENDIQVNETDDYVTAVTGNLEISFSKTNGTINAVTNKNGNLSFTGGPTVSGTASKITNVEWKTDDDDHFVMEISTDNYPEKMVWKLTKDGLLWLEASPLKSNIRDVDFIGISFNYPEENCKAVQWMGKGPYRVWKNRMKGNNIGVWKKKYNNTITGESFNELIYPEFKGYHGNLYWAKLETSESPITIASGTPNLFFQLFKPGKPGHIMNGVYPPFPEGDISFLYEIPAIGTKFREASQKMGNTSAKGAFIGHHGDDTYPIKLLFDLRGE